MKTPAVHACTHNYKAVDVVVAPLAFISVGGADSFSISCRSSGVSQMVPLNVRAFVVSSFTMLDFSKALDMDSVLLRDTSGS